MSQGFTNQPVTATDLDIRDLAHTQDSVRIGDGTDLALVSAAGALLVDASATTQPVSGTITVTATNLDIRDLTHTADTVRLGDGTDLTLVTAAGELNVLATAQPGVDIGDVTINNAAGGSAVNIQDGGNAITVDGTVAISNPDTQYTEADVDTSITGTAVMWEDTSDTLRAASAAKPLPVRLPFDSTIIQATPSVLNATVFGLIDHDSPITGIDRPLVVGGRASATAPSDVSADNDAVKVWLLRNGTVATVLTAAGALIGGDATNGLDVDVIRLPASTNTLEVVGDVAHDAPNAGNPVLVAGSTETMADSAPANRTSADGDASRFSVTDGALFVIPTGPQSWTYHEDSSAALTDTSVHAAPSAGLSLYVTDISFSLGAATAINIFFEEGASTVLGPWYLEAVNGRGLAIHFGTPKKITAATALTVTTSAAVAHSIDIQGFIAPG